MAKRIFIFLLTISLVSSCIVSRQKYDDLLVDKVTAEASLEEAREKIETLEKENEALREALSQIKSDTSTKYPELRQRTEQLAALTEKHSELQQYYDDLVANKAQLSEDLKQQQADLIEARKALEIERLRNEELLEEIRTREARLNDLERVLAEEREAVNALKKKVSDALLNFTEDELQVEIRNGKVYVSLSEKLLFQTGSRTVDSKGRQALQKLAEALKGNQNITVMVEGHTDDVPVNSDSKYLNDNWDLSVLRATTVVDILVKNGLSPDKVVAAGKGEYAPVASNETVEGKQKNRRTEIILTPNLDELFEILEKN